MSTNISMNAGAARTASDHGHADAAARFAGDHGPSTLVDLRCLRCDKPATSRDPGAGCPSCEQAETPSSFTTVYDLDAAARTFTVADRADRPFGPARYAELMPPGAGTSPLREGATPLIRLARLGARIGLANLWLKDESRNPTWSFKDRAAAIAATSARTLGRRGLVVSSTGNAAAATAAAAATVGLPALVFVTPDTDAAMLRFVCAFPVTMIAAPTKRDRWRFMRHCIEHFDYAPNSNYADPPVGNDPIALDGYKAIGFEIWEQLGFRAPAVIAMPVGYGDALFAVHKAFGELATVVGSSRPRLLGGEVSGSLSRALRAGSDTVGPATRAPSTLATSIATPRSTYQALRALRDSDGHAVPVSDDQVLAAQLLLAGDEGIFVEMSSAAALAALRQAVVDGRVAPDDDTVIVNTSSGLKTGAAQPAVPTPLPDIAAVDLLLRDGPRHAVGSAVH